MSLKWRTQHKPPLPTCVGGDVECFKLPRVLTDVLLGGSLTKGGPVLPGLVLDTTGPDHLSTRNS